MVMLLMEETPTIGWSDVPTQAQCNVLMAGWLGGVEVIITDGMNPPGHFLLYHTSGHGVNREKR